VNFSTALTRSGQLSPVEPVFIDDLLLTDAAAIVSASAGQAGRRLLSGNAIAVPQRRLLQAQATYAQAGAIAIFAPQTKALPPPPS